MKSARPNPRGSFEALSATFIETDFVKGIVDGGTAAVDVLTTIIDKLGSTFTSEDGQHAINVTPILTDGNGRPMGVLSPELLEKYAMEILNGGEDNFGIQIGATFHGEDALDQAVAAAETIHELQNEYYGEEVFDVVNLDEVRKKLAAYNVEAREIDDIISGISENANVITFDSQG